ncbi:WD40 repeat-like protein [Xylona heveae TC161]|uniref:WD40 repeat-like protein n=1 Tax=Xylona heveae (strain CBS 132557 / TC161) TaxID=1328760 RepID=A0A165JV19_XYLHT|nr:WD40 repeat-like protein [Xylona heveae TC161]KZF26667.1 WD40 repeat-like protein [Xylona heveae TC161]
MTETVPEIRVTDSHAPDEDEFISPGASPNPSPGASPSLSPSPSLAATVSSNETGPKSRSDGEAKPTATSKILPNKIIRNLSAKDALNQSQTSLPQSADDSQASLAVIDPLSQHILKRTHTENLIPQKLRSSALEAAGNRDDGSAVAPPGDRSAPAEPARGETSAAAPQKEKRKGVSFLSRFMGNKRRDSSSDYNEDGSEQGDSRIEGMEARVFSHPVEHIAYSPRFPPPPKYIKVRSRNKREKDFNRLFLAQELQNSSTAEASQTSPTPKACATWALEFSKDGKYLAAGGEDKVVRVWAVISTQEEREAHENEEDATADHTGEDAIRLDAPVFKRNPIRVYKGHTSTVLDLSWSKNNFLLSSSMDKTVRLWHVSRAECLCCFKHNDFVTSIQFHPRDDRFFLAGSLDMKLRLWSIPDKSVAYWNQVPDLVTAVAFTPDGRIAIAGCLNGVCLFYDTEGLKYHTQIHVRSAHGRNAKGSKITGIQAINLPPDNPNGEVKLLITSNDSRVRLYNFRDKGLEIKFKGNENTCSQIRATFSDDARYVICGSEDRKAYIWTTGPAEGEKKDRQPVEFFEAHPAITTTAIFAPSKTRQLLGRSGDPLYDICNPPPVVLVSAESEISSKRSDDNLKATTTKGSSRRPSTNERPAESPGYIARSTHKNGNIIITADYLGLIKVFRQDCAYQKRRSDNWETASSFSRRIGSGFLGRSPSTSTKASAGRLRSNHNNALHGLSQPSSDRILSWRNSIVSNQSLDGGIYANANGNRHRSSSPRKPVSRKSFQSSRSAHRPTTNGSSHLARTPSASAPSLELAQNQQPQHHDHRFHIPLTSKSQHKQQQQQQQQQQPSTQSKDSLPSTSPPPPSQKQQPPQSNRSSTTTNGTTIPAAAAAVGAGNANATTSTPSSRAPSIPGLPKTTDENPLALQGDQSYLFWDQQNWRGQQFHLWQTDTGNGPNPNGEAGGGGGAGGGGQAGSDVDQNGLLRPPRASVVSRNSISSTLSSEESPLSGESSDDDADDEQLSCRRCGSTSFKAKTRARGGPQKLVCTNCGMTA